MTIPLFKDLSSRREMYLEFRKAIVTGIALNLIRVLFKLTIDKWLND